MIGFVGFWEFNKILKIWQKAHELTLRTYVLTDQLPRDEKFGITSQLRRAALACESDIAEGETRYTQAAKINMFVDSRSSNAEVQTQLMVVSAQYPRLSEEADQLRLEYELLAKQINSLITYRRKNDNWMPTRRTVKQSNNQTAEISNNPIT